MLRPRWNSLLRWRAIVAKFVLVAVIASLYGWYCSPLAWGETPIRADVCHIKADPAAFNHKLVEVEGFVTHGYEDFSLNDMQCADYPGIWLEYGGTEKSDTIYCCGPTAGSSRPKELVVEGISVPLLENELFQGFNQRIHPPKYESAMVRATLVGRFFAGRKQTYPNGYTAWEGFGHFGCCSLLAISEVKAVDLENRGDLDQEMVPPVPPPVTEAEAKKRTWRFLLPENMDDYIQSIMRQQHEADSGLRSWAFEDSRRVAYEVIEKDVHGEPPSQTLLRETHRSPGAISYQLYWVAKHTIYSVVVSRLYWLSFYALSPHRVAWVVTSAYAEAPAKGRQTRK